MFSSDRWASCIASIHILLALIIWFTPCHLLGCAVRFALVWPLMFNDATLIDAVVDLFSFSFDLGFLIVFPSVAFLVCFRLSLFVFRFMIFACLGRGIPLFFFALSLFSPFCLWGLGGVPSRVWVDCLVVSSLFEEVVSVSLWFELDPSP